MHTRLPFIVVWVALVGALVCTYIQFRLTEVEEPPAVDAPLTDEEIADKILRWEMPELVDPRLWIYIPPKEPKEPECQRAQALRTERFSCI